MGSGMENSICGRLRSASKRWKRRVAEDTEVFFRSSLCVLSPHLSAFEIAKSRKSVKSGCAYHRLEGAWVQARYGAADVWQFVCESRPGMPGTFRLGPMFHIWQAKVSKERFDRNRRVLIKR